MADRNLPLTPRGAGHRVAVAQGRTPTLSDLRTTSREQGARGCRAKQPIVHQGLVECLPARGLWLPGWLPQPLWSPLFGCSGGRGLLFLLGGESLKLLVPRPQVRLNAGLILGLVLGKNFDSSLAALDPV
jgi:hypothetical protein